MMKINTYLIKLEHHQGPFIKEDKTAFAAVLQLLDVFGLRYSNNKFEVRQINAKPN